MTWSDLFPPTNISAALALPTCEADQHRANMETPRRLGRYHNHSFGHDGGSLIVLQFFKYTAVSYNNASPIQGL